MRILVTGGAGYIASHTMIELLAAGHEPLAVDNFAGASRRALEAVAAIAGQDFRVVECDLRDGEKLGAICGEFRPEAVLHFAGLKSVGESVARPLEYYEVNIGGTVALLKAMDAAGCVRIVFSSSATVYGVPQYLPLDEAHPLSPVNPYGRSKFFIEGMLADWCGADGGRAALSLRYFNPVGAHGSGRIGEAPQTDGSAPPNNLAPAIAEVAAGKCAAITVFGNDYDTDDGTGVRDYIHVCDLAAGHVSAIDFVARNAGFDAINLGTGRGHSVLEVIAAFERASGRKIKHVFAPRRPGDVAACYTATAKAEMQLGWKATRDLDAMCADAWAWQEQNPEGFGS